MESQVKRVALLIVATNRYTQFLEGLLDSADNFFLKDCEVQYCVFTNKADEVFEDFWAKPVKPYWGNRFTWQGVKLFNIEHKPFPYPTLHRFHFFQRYKEDLGTNPHESFEADYFFYVDVDALFQKEIKAEDILGERVAVQHCGYVGERGTYETRPESTSYIAPNEGEQYFGGGFWGFSKNEFWKLVDWAVDAIDTDEKNGIVPLHHDESALNRYLVDNPPTKILSPDYHYPEKHPHIYGKWRKKGLSFEPIILLLDKNHKEVRA